MPRDHALDAVLAPLPQARGLPNAHYTSDGMYADEVRRLLFATWTAVAFSADVAAGEAVPLDFAGQPLVAVRDRQGVLRVFVNVCRHRGMILVAERCAVGGVLRCPYHSWCYAPDGRLVATPHVGGPGQNAHPDIDRATLGLVELPSREWRGVVFVNVDGQVPPFADHAAQAMDLWAETEGAAMHCDRAGGFSLEVACNWKLAVENYAESYHLPWVHPGLNSYSRLEDHYPVEVPGAFSGQGTRVYRQLEGAQGRHFPDFPGLSDRWQTGAEYLALYPNLLLGLHRDHAFAILLLPQGPARTVERVALFYPTAEAADAPDWQDLRQRNTEQWRAVFKEDIGVVEGMQKGRAALAFDGGRFSPAMDGPTHCFHRWVAERMAG